MVVAAFSLYLNSLFFQVSSDSEEPIIFHRNLKVSELDYDDEKDLDTSLSSCLFHVLTKLEMNEG